MVLPVAVLWLHGQMNPKHHGAQPLCMHPCRRAEETKWEAPAQSPKKQARLEDALVVAAKPPVVLAIASHPPLPWAGCLPDRRKG